ncbi:hypothetical protein FIBSPDRAFT_852966 [Athelia psychrophila]|uniref:Uncharacterized protein n=1 Tax=Athelia psychrophila TaxID=1759441 RepID=A0A166RBW3_9AGAM|nr:hypothetical protein FIBSPDRAFT_852966 [Fibularhizoctonia sp. CBS 109695]
MSIALSTYLADVLSQHAEVFDFGSHALSHSALVAQERTRERLEQMVDFALIETIRINGQVLLVKMTMQSRNSTGMLGENG